MAFSFNVCDLLFLCTLFGAGIMDLWKRTIPNSLLLGSGILLLIGKYCVGSSSLLRAFFCAGLTLILAFPAWQRGMIGGGDVKLCSLLFFWSPDLRGLEAFFLALLCAAAYGLYKLCRQGLFWIRISYFWTYVKNACFSNERQIYYERERDGDAPVIPLAVSLLIGTAVRLMFCVSFTHQ